MIDSKDDHVEKGQEKMISMRIQGWAFATIVLACSVTAQAQLVPGTGVKVSAQSDDFESEKWGYKYNMPKSSREQDGKTRGPLAYSYNKKWREGGKRGTPDSVVRVETPPGGITGSQYSLAIKTKNAGVPGRISYEQMQDDLLIATRSIPTSWQPSCTVRVFLPPWDQWEDRVGASFGMRVDLRTTVMGESEEDRNRGGGLFKRLFRSAFGEEVEPYWPGIFIQFNSKTDPRFKYDHAMFVIRGDSRGHEFAGPKITQPGWWTLGISVTADGSVHYYASPGVDDLTAADHISSQKPYGYSAERFTTMFFNVVTMDDGKTWSTEWIIDDPAIYYVGNRFQAGMNKSTKKR